LNKEITGHQELEKSKSSISFKLSSSKYMNVTDDKEDDVAGYYIDSMNYSDYKFDEPDIDIDYSEQLALYSDVKSSTSLQPIISNSSNEWSESSLNMSSSINNQTKFMSVLSPEVAARAVNMASGMADWAGRAVEKVLKEHLVSQGISTHSQSKSHLTAYPNKSVKFSDIVDYDTTIKSHSSSTNYLLSPSLIKKEEIKLENQDGSIVITPRIEEKIHNRSSFQKEILATIKSDGLNKEDLEQALHDEEMLERLARKSRALDMRDAEAMTDEMRDDVIALLNILDIPYIIAPYEAEAQCAVLEQVTTIFTSSHYQTNLKTVLIL
jgi:hypothetical protein